MKILPSLLMTGALSQFPQYHWFKLDHESINLLYMLRYMKKIKFDTIDQNLSYDEIKS